MILRLDVSAVVRCLAVVAILRHLTSASVQALRSAIVSQCCAGNLQGLHPGLLSCVHSFGSGDPNSNQTQVDQSEEVLSPYLRDTAAGVKGAGWAADWHLEDWLDTRMEMTPELF